MRNRLIIIICIVLFIFLLVFAFFNNDFYKYKKMVKKSNWVAHALGGIDNNSYTNSKEALENSYKHGFRLFEVDIKYTSDNKLVCVHDWTKTDYEDRLGLEYDEESPIMSYDEFMSIKIKDKYTPLSFNDFISFMKDHKDMYVMIDIGNKEYDDTKNIYSDIVKTAGNDKKVLNRMIVGGHDTSMIEAVKSTYRFPIINLYWAPKPGRNDKKIDTREEFVKYCKDNNITSLSTSVRAYNEDKDIIKFFKDSGLIIYLFTENDKEKANTYLQNVDLVGTDFIGLS